MHACLVIGLVTWALHSLTYDWTFLMMYIVLVAAYYFFVTKFSNPKENTKRKTMMIGTWNEGNDPTSYTIEDLNVTKTLEYIAELNKDSATNGVEVRMIHFMTHAIAIGQYKIRKDVGRIQHGSFKHAKRIGVSSLIDTKEGFQIPITFWDAHNTSIVEFAKLYEERKNDLLEGKNSPWLSLFK